VKLNRVRRHPRLRVRCLGDHLCSAASEHEVEVLVSLQQHERDRGPDAVDVALEREARCRHDARTRKQGQVRDRRRLRGQQPRAILQGLALASRAPQRPCAPWRLGTRALLVPKPPGIARKRQ
jgi:hypothetical protein